MILKQTEKTPVSTGIFVAFSEYSYRSEFKRLNENVYVIDNKYPELSFVVK